MPPVRQTNGKAQPCPQSEPVKLSVSLALGYGRQSAPEYIPFGKAKLCGHCRTLIALPSDMARHQRAVHENDGPWYICYFCPLKADRLLSNLHKHTELHIEKGGMICREVGPSGTHCDISFTSVDHWFVHRLEVHDIPLPPILYTKKTRSDGDRDQLAASDDMTNHNVAMCMNELHAGFSDHLLKQIQSEPPIPGATLRLSPAAFPYWFRNIQWEELEDPTLRARMIQVQTRLKHDWCLSELRAIDQRLSSATSSNTPYRLSSAIFPL